MGTTTNLLERLRRGCRDAEVAVDPVTHEEADRKAKLIADHRSEFPPPLRLAIASASWLASEDGGGARFLSEVYGAVKAIFLAHRPHVANSTGDTVSSPSPSPSPSPSLEQPRMSKRSKRDDNETVEDWHGLDSKRDTEDQVELAIRIFPAILSETIPGVPIPGIGSAMVGCWCARAETVAFVPLAVRMCEELLRGCAGTSLTPPRYLIAKQLLIPGRRTFRELFQRNHRNLLWGALSLSLVDAASVLFGPGNEPRKTAKLEEASLSALVRMEQVGLVHRRDDTSHLLKWLLTRAHRQPKAHRVEFTEARLRLLIDWDPTVLGVFPHGGNTPLVGAFDGCCPRTSKDDDEFVLALFERIVERGMVHFPDELGFVFHRAGENGISSSAFRDVSSRHGTERVAAIVRRRLLGSGRRSVQSLVLAAAAHDRIGLDGVYHLARADPAALLPSRGTGHPPER